MNEASDRKPKVEVPAVRPAIVDALRRPGPQPRGGLGAMARLSLVAAVALPLLVAGCTRQSATPEGREIAALYDVMLVVVAAIFLLVEGTIVWSLIRYRQRRGDATLPPQVHGHRGLEIVWTAIPILIVLGIYVLSLQTLGKVEAKASNPLVVEVHGYQWYWDFDLPDEGVKVSGLGTEPELVLPVGQPIRFRLMTDNVIHSFYVPAFLFKRDLTPGTVSEFDLTIDEPGIYAGQCAEFCGAGHADMRLRIRAVPAAEFQAWVADQRAAASASPSPSTGASPEASASAPPAGATITLVAQNIAFVETSLDAPANTPFVIEFDNQDARVPHNVQIKDSSGASVFKGEIVTGPTRVTYQVPALAPGTYTFVCDVHPTTMTGTITVK